MYLLALAVHQFGTLALVLIGQHQYRHKARQYALEQFKFDAIGGALGALNSWINRTPDPSQADAALMDEFDKVLGVLDLTAEAPASEASDEDAYIDDLVRRRTEARASKDWGEADRIRDELAALAKPAAEFMPRADDGTLARRARQWAKAVARSRDWTDADPVS